ncbi:MULTISPECIES: glutamyl-tRNA reductase [Dietzia]|uniref:Glutamyl-tRNA reductase n=1 Tax=Dietzia maris TaxID=37915 RepID=A0ABT8H4W8_9ACTN|nr:MULTISPECIES: glutamyl-tRNA reductase [Dietzia]MCZ4540782.1 glutamyl-tRNA reductase [Dietzia maris]MCZ4656662.1 glutamyl-tRNA reductase [Dietzia kunjamensis]MDJ0424043.1 glutamyl-tRNA reductase [Dietzia kunjamensis]MDN4507014.1 glutamyl-tRNA reductase [Dietzia maris]MDV3354354.1 glutamyl-tRNA reductase [Dietzia sp. IN118]
MSILLVGLSHHSAPVSLLEAVAVSESERDGLTEELIAGENVDEAMIVTTCNRVEVYSAVDAFHPALDDVVTLLSRHSGLGADELSRHLYVRYSESAAEHLFSVASGLDSMVVGEQQIIGQIRTAYQSASEIGAAGTTLHRLAQQALHVGKRVHTETGIDSAGASVVSVALDRAAEILSDGASRTLDGRRAVVLGAGAMGGLAVAHLGRGGISHIEITNRTPERADRLAEIAGDSGTPATAFPLDGLAEAVARADILFTCTGAVGTVVTLGDVHTALARRGDRGPLVICDLGMPRDVDPAVAGLPGVTVLGIEALKADPATSAAAADADAARTIVDAELTAYTQAERMAGVGPLIGQLRGRGGQVVAAEMRRLESRLPDMDEKVRDEVANTVRRVVDKLLHPPTVRFRELAAQPDGENYAAVVRTLFDLDNTVDGRSEEAS